MRLGSKGGRAHVRDPNLDRTKALTAQAITMLLHLHARRLGLGYRDHEKSPIWLHVTYHGEEYLTTLLAVLRYTVALEIAQVSIDRLGADELPASNGSALRVEPHDTGLHCDPRGPRADPTSRLQGLRFFSGAAAAVPRPRALNRPLPFAVPLSREGAPPAGRVACWICPAKLVGRARAAGAPSTRSKPTPISGLAGAESEVIIIARHGMTIGGRRTRDKEQNADIVE